ncbi:hypothetical protein ACHAW5_000074 [Stephanodiscus triporus]|uniref:SGNH hydrolase-type esterase domain-containing protein n=1 Tax=Stephanodiscus triporus TaxID=2934178 RepID=A0ABD3N5H9_9STRA
MTTTSSGGGPSSSPPSPPPSSARHLRVFCYGDSLTSGTSPPSGALFPYGPHLEDELNLLLAARSTTASSSSSSRSPHSTAMVRWRGLPGWTAATNARASRLRECVNDALRRFAEEEEEEEEKKGGGGGRETYYVDFPFPFARRGDDVVGDDDYSKLWNPDGLHLSEIGYETLGRRLAPCVLDILEGI